MAVGAVTVPVARAMWTALQAPSDRALEENVTIVTSVAAVSLVGAVLRPDPRMRWSARLLYTALGCLIAIWIIGGITHEWG